MIIKNLTDLSYNIKDISEKSHFQEQNCKFFLWNSEIYNKNYKRSDYREYERQFSKSNGLDEGIF